MVLFEQLYLDEQPGIQNFRLSLLDIKKRIHRLIHLYYYLLIMTCYKYFYQIEKNKFVLLE